MLLIELFMKLNFECWGI